MQQGSSGKQLTELLFEHCVQLGWYLTTNYLCYAANGYTRQSLSNQ